MQGEPKPWKCPSGRHILGQVVRNGSGIRQLLLYRKAVELTAGAKLEESEVIAIVEGYVSDVRCDLCGRMRTWVPGKEALCQLVERWLEMHGRDDG
jgi:hypothetical protein